MNVQDPSAACHVQGQQRGIQTVCHGAQCTIMYLYQTPRRLPQQGEVGSPAFTPKPRQPRLRFSVGLKGWRQQHLSPNHYLLINPITEQTKDNQITDNNLLQMLEEW